MLQKISKSYEEQRVFYRPEPWFHVLFCKLHVWWRHDVGDITYHFLSSRSITGISFKLIPLLEPKLLNFVNFAILVCKLHRKQVAKQVTLFLWINYWGLLLVKISSSHCVWFLRSLGRNPANLHPNFTFCSANPIEVLASAGKTWSRSFNPNQGSPRSRKKSPIEGKCRTD